MIDDLGQRRYAMWKSAMDDHDAVWKWSAGECHFKLLRDGSVYACEIGKPGGWFDAGYTYLMRGASPIPSLLDKANPGWRDVGGRP